MTERASRERSARRSKTDSNQGCRYSSYTHFLSQLDATHKCTQYAGDHMGKKMKTYIRLILAVAICEMAGIAGSIFTAPAIPTWYASLKKPPLAPPNWVFAPVWTTLYFLMGISLFIVWNAGIGKSTVRKSIAIFSIQLVLNVLWSYLFFGLRSPLLGLAGIMAMWFMIVLTVVSFFRISKTAALVLIPYLIWDSFASYLNYSILTLNP